jgi:hypothetical protein
MSKGAVAVACVFSLSVALGGCAGTHASGDPVARTPASSPSPAAGSPSPMLTPSAPARTPLGTGERVWAAFSERGLSYAAWWRQLRPLLSDSARAVYVYDDPSNIPELELTGKIHLAARAPGEPRYTAEVVVPTNKGVFDLDLERHTLASRWLLYAIKFPPGVQ